MNNIEFNEEQLQFARDLTKCLIWRIDDYVDTKETVKGLSKLGYHKTIAVDNYKKAYQMVRNRCDEFRKEAEALDDENQKLKEENRLRCQHQGELLRKYNNLKEEIFKRLYALLKFDGHSIGVWKVDLVTLAEEYGVLLGGKNDDC